MVFLLKTLQISLLEWQCVDCRLSICLRESSLFFQQTNQKIIVFNGEIYNYKVLKQEHLGEYHFKTNSDTEVIIALYEKYGVDSFSLLEGNVCF